MALTEDPRTAPSIRWGILGAGGIAAACADAVRSSTRAPIVAVGSRDRTRSERFATAHGIPTTHVGYRDLVEDPQVDAVYVATPHSEHREHALLAIAAGKHVLVEKAFTRNAGEAEEVFAAARAAGVFVMEAMWTRFLPHVAAVHQVIDSGEIGEIVAVHADHGQYFPFDPAHRLYDPALAGGALTETGVDGQLAIVLSYGDRTQAALTTTLWARTPTTAAISGTEGTITIEGSFYAPTSFRVSRRDGRSWTFDQPVAHGLQYEAAEVARRVAEGATESPRMTWADTLGVLRTMDEVRAQVGVVYPGE